MYRDYIESILSGCKYDADTGSNGGDHDGEQENGSSDESDNTQDSANGDTADKQQGKEGRTFSRAELAAIVAEETRKAVEDAKAKAESEAEKFAGLNDVQKLELQNKQLAEENAKYKEGEQRSLMAKEAVSLLSDHDIVATDEMLDLIVQTTAEGTSKGVMAIVALHSQIEEALIADFEKRLGSKETLGGNTSLAKGEGAFGKELAERNKTEVPKKTYFK